MQIEQLEGLTIVKVLEGYNDRWILEMSDGKKYSIEALLRFRIEEYGDSEYDAELGLKEYK